MTHFHIMYIMCIETEANAVCFVFGYLFCEAKQKKSDERLKKIQFTLLFSSLYMSGAKCQISK